MQALRGAGAAMEVALEAVQLFGGNGYMAEFRVEQLCRGREGPPDLRRHLAEGSISPRRDRAACPRAWRNAQKAGETHREAIRHEQGPDHRLLDRHRPGEAWSELTSEATTVATGPPSRDARGPRRGADAGARRRRPGVDRGRAGSGRRRRRPGQQRRLEVAGPVERVPLDEVRRMFETNYFGVVRLIKPSCPACESVAAASSSTCRRWPAGWVGPFGAFYAGTKFAVEALSEGLHLEMGRFGIGSWSSSRVSSGPRSRTTSVGTARTRRPMTSCATSGRRRAEARRQRPSRP